MALDSGQLEQDLIDTFSSMQNDDDFTKGISNAIKSYIENGKVETTDAGTIVPGAFTGQGEGSVTVNSSLLKSALDTACSSMTSAETGDSILASAFTTGFTAMMTAAIVNTDVSGDAISTSTPPVTTHVEGSSIGTITVNSATLLTALNDVFSEMKSKYDDTEYDGDAAFASALASEIDSIVKAGIIVTAGTGALTGVASVTASIS